MRNPEGFFSEDWDEDKQEEDEWQTPDKFQKISQMVFCNRILESHPVGGGVLSSHGVQHQGGGCAYWKNVLRICRCEEAGNLHPRYELYGQGKLV